MFSEISSRVTDGIRVNVSTTYVNEESSPKQHYYVFAYQIEIINESSYEIQLLSREWHISDGLGNHRVVKGEGVVGKQPLIAPGDMHKYISGSHFPTPIGKMSGYYTMIRTIDQSELRVEIPPFIMISPYIHN